MVLNRASRCLWVFALATAVALPLRDAVAGGIVESRRAIGPDAIAGEVRAREVAVDGAALDGVAKVGGVVALSIFDDVFLGVVIERRWDWRGGFSAAGHLDGVPGSTVSLAVERGQASVSVWSGKEVFALVPTGEVDEAGRGVCSARQLRPTETCRCDMPSGAFAAGPGMDALGLDGGRLLGELTQRVSASGAPGRDGARAGFCDCFDDQSVVDLLVVYTPAALAGAGGLSALTARYQDAVAGANQAFINSAITAGGPVNRLTVRIAGVQPISYDESAPQVINHLERLAGTSDGFMDGVHAMRDSFHADLVTLAVNDTRLGGGLGYYALTDTGAFSVVNWRALGGGNLTLAHELGHNFGCAHDRGNSDFSTFRWAWGYSFAFGGTTYGTIMSYTGAVGLPNYSNPSVIHAPTGQPMGTALSSPLATSNALAIATTRWTIANFRDAPGIKDCNGNGVDDATDIANGTSVDANLNCRPDECELRLYVDASNTGTSDGLSWNTAWPNLADALALASLKCSRVSEIWVAGGTYKPDKDGAGSTGDRSAAFRLRSGLSVIGGFRGKQRPGGGETALAQRPPIGQYPAILSGDVGVVGSDADNSYNVVLAIDTDDSAVLDGFTIERGYQDGDGAGMLAQRSAVAVRNCTLRFNRGGAGAAFAVYEAPSLPTLSACVFTGNVAVGSGGAIAVRNGAGLTANSCTIESNSSANVGGASVAFGSGATFTGCVFRSNAAASSVGALEVYSGGSITANQCLFENNHALNGNGGAVGAYFGAAATLNDCTIQGNDATGNSGAVDCYSGVTLVLDGCTISGNHAGGAAGGVTVHTNCTATVIDSAFNENAAAGSGGGAISIGGGTTLTVDASTFQGNQAAWGGAIATADSTLVVRRATMAANHVSPYNGGGLDLYNTAATVTNCLIQGNTAADGGAGIYVNLGSNITATNCTIHGNSAANAGGGIAMYEAMLTLNNSILYANTAATPAVLDKQLTVFSGTRVVNRSCVQGLSGQLGGAGNIGGNPTLVGPATGNFALGAGSPCIDAGGNALVPAGTTVDLAGGPRFRDDPATVDTGAGSAPIVDMGAYEFVPAAACPGDLNGDGGVNTQDLVTFLGRFGQVAPIGSPAAIADFNHDGVVNTVDLVYFLGRFGQVCP